jgi:hypothetical protein
MRWWTTLATVGLLVLAAPAPGVTTARRSRCLRRGETLVQRAGHVRILHRGLPLRPYTTRRYALLSCWAPTGRRTRIAMVEEFYLDLIVEERVEVMSGRYVGAELRTFAGPSEHVDAIVVDARRSRRVHDASTCRHPPSIRWEGPTMVAFLPHGGLAYTCDGLFVYPRAGSTRLQQIEPAGSHPSQLAVSPASDQELHTARLYWTTGARGTETGRVAKSMDLGF